MLCKVLLWGGSVEEQVRLEGGERLELDAANCTAVKAPKAPGRLALCRTLCLLLGISIDDHGLLLLAHSPSLAVTSLLAAFPLQYWSDGDALWEDFLHPRRVLLNASSLASRLWLSAGLLLLLLLGSLIYAAIDSCSRLGQLRMLLLQSPLHQELQVKEDLVGRHQVGDVLRRGKLCQKDYLGRGGQEGGSYSLGDIECI